MHLAYILRGMMALELSATLCLFKEFFIFILVSVVTHTELKLHPGSKHLVK